MEFATLKLEIVGKVAKLILNRPEKKNAMNPQLHLDMTALQEELRDDDAVLNFRRFPGGSVLQGSEQVERGA